MFHPLSLYQGRSWARLVLFSEKMQWCGLNPHNGRFPSPPTPRGWVLSWVKPVLAFSELEMLKLRGIDATLYIRFLRGCCKCPRTYTTMNVHTLQSGSLSFNH